MDATRHSRNILVLWLIATVIMTPIVIFVIGPGLPPGNGSVESSGQVTDNTVLLALATPVALGVLVYMAYAIWAFRERTPEVVVDGPPIRGNASVQFWWLIITTTLVLFLAGYGTVRLLADGSGGGQGPNPIAIPAVPAGGKLLVVQVVAQQWQFTYRFPGYGGFETNQIELPENTLVRFNVTSLDVIHSFWAYQLGVKADANPGVNNVAYVTTKGPLCSTCAAPSCAASGTATCSTRVRSFRGRSSPRGSRSRSRSSRRPPRACRRTRRPTSHAAEERPDERDCNVGPGPAAAAGGS